MIPDELKRMTPMKGRERLGATRDSDYMGAEDIEAGTEPTLTISALYNGLITLARGKERHDVIAFKEESVPGSINQVRPLVVNSTNRKTLRKIYRNVTAENLVGKQITLYLEPNVRDPSTGDKVDGIRIRPRVPVAKRTDPLKCADCGGFITGVGNYTAEDIARMSRQKYGAELCVACGKKRAEQAEQKEQATAEQTETNENEQNYNEQNDKENE